MKSRIAALKITYETTIDPTRKSLRLTTNAKHSFAFKRNFLRSLMSVYRVIHTFSFLRCYVI